MHRFLIVVASLVGEHRLQRHMGSVAVASGLYSSCAVVVAGLVAPQHAGTTQTRDGSRVNLFSLLGHQFLKIGGLGLIVLTIHHSTKVCPIYLDSEYNSTHFPKFTGCQISCLSPRLLRIC